MRHASENNQENAMGNRKLRVGQAITPEEFEELSEEELTRLVPRQYRDYFPGKDACGDGFFTFTMAPPGVSTRAAFSTTSSDAAIA
jgi:hypothetical protein